MDAWNRYEEIDAIIGRGHTSNGLFGWEYICISEMSGNITGANIEYITKYYPQHEILDFIDIGPEKRDESTIH